jgi:hypothetical protein
MKITYRTKDFCNNFKVEIDNLKIYNGGIKGVYPSMIEAAMNISNNNSFRSKS